MATALLRISPRAALARVSAQSPFHRPPPAFRFMSSKSYEHIITSKPEAGVALIQLNRPKALNALSSALFSELNDAVAEFDNENDVHAIVLTGSERAFAAGADIKEMQNKTFVDAYTSNFLESWGLLTKAKKPIIAAVSGYALGGGFELALMCDVILASPTAKFGLPEITLGVIPGGGGTQRLAHAVGKSRATELILTGRTFSAEDAERWGVISRVVAEGEGEVVKEAVELGKQIAAKGRVSVFAAKEAINAAFELPLAEGLRLERRLFHTLFATADQKEGMTAFVEKRKAQFTHS